MSDSSNDDALRAEVAELRAEVARLKERDVERETSWDAQVNRAFRYRKERDALRAEVEQLRQQVASLMDAADNAGHVNWGLSEEDDG